MTKYLQYNLIFFMCVVYSISRKIEIMCPEHCNCDMFLNLRRANCTNRKLITLEAFIPNVTQILDVSFNQISELRDHIFADESLLSLQLLNISHNKLSQIHINAFYGLNRLKTLDVSYNSMQYILPNWFWSLESLEELYLRENAFRNLGDDPFFISKSLKILDMARCKISSLGTDVFIKLPNLEFLDLSENLMIQLSVNIISPLKRLKELNVTGNPFDCSIGFSKNLSNYCYEHEILYVEPCKKVTRMNQKTFERMEMSTSAVNMANKKNSWIFDDKEENNSKVETIVEKCPNETQIKNGNKSLLMEIIELSPELSILITLIYGIMIGLVIGCTVQIGNTKHSEPITRSRQRKTLLTNRRKTLLTNTSERLRRSRNNFMSTLSLKSRRNDDSTVCYTML